MKNIFISCLFVPHFSTDMIPENFAVAVDKIRPYNVMPVYGKYKVTVVIQVVIRIGIVKYCPQIPDILWDYSLLSDLLLLSVFKLSVKMMVFIYCWIRRPTYLFIFFFFFFRVKLLQHAQA